MEHSSRGQGSVLSHERLKGGGGTKSKGEKNYTFRYHNRITWGSKGNKEFCSSLASPEKEGRLEIGQLVF